MMISNYQTVQRIRKLQLQPWNTGGYKLAQPSPMFLDEYLLPSVAALDTETSSLLAFHTDETLTVDIIKYFPFESEDRSEAVLHVERKQIGTRSGIVHAASGLPGEPHFALDAENRRIIEIPALTDLVSDVSSRVINFDLPAGVRLSAESRLAVLPRDLARPELMTPALFLSAPESHVVLEVNRASGSTTVVAGQIGRSGAPGQNEQRSRSTARRETLGRAAHALLGSPRGLFFDEVTRRLLIADSVNGAIYGVGLEHGTIELVASSNPDHRRSGDVAYFAELNAVRGMLLYRLATLNVDAARLVRNSIDVTPAWGREPVTLIFWDDTSRVVTGWLNTTQKDRNHFSTKFLGVRSALVHPSGELLLLAADRVGLMKHPSVLTETRFSKEITSPAR